MELTWITFPTIVVSVSLLAYFAAYRLKGNDLLVNKVDVDRRRPGRGPGPRPDTLLSSSARRTATTTSGSCPSRRPRPRGAAAGRARPVGDDAASARRAPRSSLTWFSVPEAQFGGMGGRAGDSASSAAATPTSRPAALESPRGRPGPDLEHQDAHRAAGSARPDPLRRGRPPARRDRPPRRHGDQPPGRIPSKDAILAFGKQVYQLGTIAPGATRPGRAVERPQPLRATSGIEGPQLHARPAVEPQPEDQPRRPAAGPDVPRQRVEPRPASTALSNAAPRPRPDRSARPRPADAGGPDRPPGARLVLGQRPQPPKIDQTTLLRVILPLQGRRRRRPGRPSRRATDSTRPTGSNDLIRTVTREPKAHPR